MALGNKFWLARQGLEVLRLGRVRQLRWREELGAEGLATTAEEGGEGKEGGGVVRVESEELKKQWQRDVVFNLGWLPVRLYASFEDQPPSQRPVSDSWFGAFGLMSSLILLQDSWRETA